MNNQSQFRRLLYQLKKDFGMPMVYRRILSRTPNRVTGLVSVTTEDFRIRKAILMPLRSSITFEHDQAYMAAGRNFTYGALYDPNQRQIIIEKRDIDFEIQKNDQLILDNKVTEILQSTLHEPMSSYLITTKYIENNQ